MNRTPPQQPQCSTVPPPQNVTFSINSDNGPRQSDDDDDDDGDALMETTKFINETIDRVVSHWPLMESKLRKREVASRLEISRMRKENEALRKEKFELLKALQLEKQRLKETQYKLQKSEQRFLCTCKKRSSPKIKEGSKSIRCSTESVDVPGIPCNYQQLRIQIKEVFPSTDEATDNNNAVKEVNCYVTCNKN